MNEFVYSTGTETVSPPLKGPSPATKPGWRHAGRWLRPLLVIAAVLLVWWAICFFRIFPGYSIPSPGAVMAAFGEIWALNLFNDIVASLWRVTVGFSLAVLAGVPLGLFLGSFPAARHSLAPILQFFRFLSPLAWIPFAILWFRIGDPPAIFLIFLATVFPLTLGTLVAVGNIPKTFLKVAKDYHYSGTEKLSRVVLPAVLPEVLTSMRICFGIAWVVIVAAEMVGCQDGLGYGIWNARNGLRLDIAVAYMITIGLLGYTIDRLFVQATQNLIIPWQHEK